MTFNSTGLQPRLKKRRFKTHQYHQSATISTKQINYPLIISNISLSQPIQ